jgi:hypothetical protein
MRGRLDNGRLPAVAAGLGALALAGCGSSGKYANDPRPPTPIVVTAAITPSGVSVSPDHFGAGPISLVVTNQTSRSQRVTISQQINGQSQDQEQTAPINPQDTGTLKADLDPGRYTVHVDDTAARPARLVVGPKRPSAQNQLLQP